MHWHAWFAWPGYRRTSYNDPYGRALNPLIEHTEQRRNPAFAEKDWPPAVVGSLYQTGVNLMRDLVRRGVHAVGVDFNRHQHGFRSVYGKPYLCPHPATDGEQWVKYMRNLSRELGAKPVFIPSADVFVTAWGQYAGELQDCYIACPEAARLQSSLTSKETQYGLAERHGFPCPRMAYVQSEEDLREFAREARFPCLIKPRSQSEWSALPAGNPLQSLKIVMADTPEELLASYRFAEPYRPEAVAQEVIQGPGGLKGVYLSVLGRGSRILGSCTLKSVRDHPPFANMQSVIRPGVDDELSSLCGNFLQAIGYRGICEFEVKRDVRDGKIKLIEINPRFSGSGDCASYTRVETGWLHYLDMIGLDVVPVKPTRFDFHHIVLQLESDTSSKFVLSGDLSLRNMIAPYLGPTEFYDLSFADPRLAMETLGASARNVAANLMHHWKFRS